MSENDPIHKRGRALEDEFFKRVDDQLRAKLRQEMERDEAKTVLAKSTGFSNQELLDHLLDAGFNAATIASLALVPLVRVAWADGTVSTQERESITKMASAGGIEEGSVAYQLLESWLNHKPSPELWSLWRDYVIGLRETVPVTTINALEKQITEQATAVAGASGGLLGFGKISYEEQRVLNDINELFRTSVGSVEI